MKKKHLFLLIIIIAISIASFAQVNVGSLGFNYSALVRDTAGRVQPLRAVKLKFTLLLGQNGTAVNSPWIETQNTSTDAYGFVNVTIGNGTKTGGSASTFADVDFTLTNFWILIEVFNNFTSVYDPLAKQALQAVPYAKVAGALVGGAVIPIGTIIPFAGDQSHIPDGWLLCDGSLLDNTDPLFINLFNVIGYNWGTTNHANLFNIPDTRGLFLRGVNNNTGRDPEAAGRTPSQVGANGGDNVGSFQDEMFKSHSHGVLNTTQTANGNNAYVAGLNGPFPDAEKGVRDAGGAETRPKNVYVNYIIKY